MKSIAIFCGSSSGHDHIYQQVASAVGVFFAEKSIDIIFGGGQVGLMGKIADAALKVDGKVIGVIPNFLKTKEVAHFGLTELISTSNMHERKMLMYDMSDAFLILPGGFGTMDEFFETLTWAQLARHQKPIGVLNINGFFDPLIALIDKMIEEGFLKSDNKALIKVDSSIQSLFKKLEHYVPPQVPKWINDED